MNITKKPFGIKNGKEITAFTVSNSNGYSFTALDLGLIIQSFIAPDKDSNPKDIVLGYDDLDGYDSDIFFIGKTVGRYANRIAKSKIKIDGVKYQLFANDGKNHLHGGKEGFDTKFWESETYNNENEAGIIFNRVSPDGEENYPGKLDLKITYSLNNNNEFIMSYEAVSNKKTVINLTNHAYWNLNGADGDKITDHSLKLNCSSYLKVKKGIPTGAPTKVDGTAFDFRTAKEIGKDVEAAGAVGYDHNFVIDNYEKGKLCKIAEVKSETTGIKMDISTDLPGVQLFSAQPMVCKKPGKNGVQYEGFSGLALETQYWPDTPNRPEYPQCTFDAGEVYKTKTIHKFYK